METHSATPACSDVSTFLIKSLSLVKAAINLVSSSLRPAITFV